MLRDAGMLWKHGIAACFPLGSRSEKKCKYNKHNGSITNFTTLMYYYCYCLCNSILRNVNRRKWKILIRYIFSLTYGCMQYVLNAPLLEYSANKGLFLFNSNRSLCLPACQYLTHCTGNKEPPLDKQAAPSLILFKETLVDLKTVHSSIWKRPELKQINAGALAGCTSSAAGL